MYSCVTFCTCLQVSTRALLACGGVLAAVLGIVSSLGFLSYLGVEYVNFVGIMPFLVMGGSFVMSSCLSWSWVGLLSRRHACPGNGWVFCHVVMPVLIMGGSFVTSSCLSWSWVGLLSRRHACPGHGWVFCHVFLSVLVMGGSSFLSGHGWVFCRVTMPFLVTVIGLFVMLPGLSWSWVSLFVMSPGLSWSWVVLFDVLNVAVFVTRDRFVKEPTCA